VLDWHPSTEEGLLLGGIADEPGRMTKGAYVYRQPGFLHGPAIAPRYEGVTIVQRVDRPLRILRYQGTKYPMENGQAVTEEHKDWPIDQQLRIDTEALPWEDAPAGGGWAGGRYKWLHRNKRNGGGAALVDLPAGWEGRGPSGRQVIEEFVVEGSIDVGGEHYVKWGYACRAAGAPAGGYRTADGARLCCWWDEGSELE
jgi:hypothetical protein